MRYLDTTRRAAWALCGVALLGAGPVLAQLTLEANPAAKPAGLVVPGETPDVVLVSSGDVIGYVDPCG